MALTITNGDFQIFSGVVLDALIGETTPFDAFSTRFESSLQENDILKVPIYTDTSTPTDFDASTNNYETVATDSITFRDVTLDSHLKSTFSITDKNWQKVNIEELLRIHTKKVIKQAQAEVGALITNANFGAAAFTGAASTFDSDDLADLWNTAETNNFGANRYALLTTGYWANLLKDNDLKNYLNSNTDEVLKRATLPQVAGFNIALMKHLPANGENLVGFITDKSAICVASAPIRPLDDAIMWQTVTDPVSGFTIGMRMHYSASVGAMFWTLESQFGYALGQAAGLERMVSA